MTLESWFALLATCIALSISPGPSSTYALSTSIRSGHQAGLKAVMGSTLGFSSLILIALVGLTAFVSSMPWLLQSLKLVGAAYLLFLAWTLWRYAAANTSSQAETRIAETETGIAMAEVAQTESTNVKSHNTAIRGFLIALSNPKVVLFWLAFIPSILTVDSLTMTAMIVVIATFALVEASAELSLVWLGAKAQRFLRQHVQLIDRASAVIFVAFALVILLSE